MSTSNERQTRISENIIYWRVSPQLINLAMAALAEKYLEDDRFPQGDNEEVSLLSSSNKIVLRVTRIYTRSELEKIHDAG